MNDLELQDKLVQLREARAAVTPALEALADLEREIRAEIVRRGESVTFENVTVQYRGPSVRVTWDSKALDGFAVAYRTILRFRKETAVAPSAAISIRDN